MNGYRTAQQGLGLVEIMISLALSLGVLAGIYTVFTSTRASYQLQSALSQLQESTRFSAQRLIRDIRQAGYLGCATNRDTVKNNLNGAATSQLSNFNVAVMGYTATSLPPSLGISGVVPNTDVISIHTTGARTGLIADIPSRDAPDFRISAAAAQALQPGDIVLLGDCRRATIVQITSINGSPCGARASRYGRGGASLAHDIGTCVPGNATSTLARAYRAESTFVQQLKTVTYFIRKDAASGRPALWVKTGSGTAQELVKGVDNMQVRYGLDNTSGYLSASMIAPSAWANVTSVELSLLFESDHAIPNAEPTRIYSLLGTSLSPFNDRRLRKAITFSVAIRNRLPWNAAID